MNPTRVLRIEGLAAFVAGLGAFLALDGALWLLALLALAPDVSMLGYLAGRRVGTLTYNVAHTYTVPAALAAVALATGTTPALLVAAVWVAHIGADRALGYGLKYESGFGDTHLSAATVPTDDLDPEPDPVDTV